MNQVTVSDGLLEDWVQFVFSEVDGAKYLPALLKGDATKCRKLLEAGSGALLANPGGME